MRGLIPDCREDGVNISTPGKLQETEGAGIHDGSSHPGSCLWGWESRQSYPQIVTAPRPELGDEGPQHSRRSLVPPSAGELLCSSPQTKEHKQEHPHQPPGFLIQHRVC